MLTQVDHIDMRVNDLEATVETLKKMGLQEKRRTPAPRSSVEMALPGENQVTFELRPANGNPQGSIMLPSARAGQRMWKC